MLTEEQLSRVAEKGQGEVDALSPFVYKKIDLAHLEMKGEIVLKFRKSNYLDAQWFREKEGSDMLVAAFTKLDPVKMVEVLLRFLSNESKAELSKLKFVSVGNDGKTMEVAHPLDKRFALLFVSAVDGAEDLLNTFLNIIGYTKEQLLKLNELEQEAKKANKANKKKGARPKKKT